MSGTNAINFARSLNEQNIAQLRKNNLRAYMVHFGQTLGPKVFITRSKQRMVNPEVPDPYSKQRQCGGKHTVTQQMASPRTFYSNNIVGKTKCLRDLFQEEEFVAAGALDRSEQVLHGADGKPYKGRSDVITFDEKLTQVLQDKSEMGAASSDESKRATKSASRLKEKSAANNISTKHSKNSKDWNNNSSANQANDNNVIDDDAIIEPLYDE